MLTEQERKDGIVDVQPCDAVKPSSFIIVRNNKLVAEGKIGPGAMGIARPGDLILLNPEAVESLERFVESKKRKEQ